MERYEDLENMSEEDEFIERTMHEIEQNELQSIDVALDVGNEFAPNPQLDENSVTRKPKKRRSNLTEFDESQSIKRRNESAKRELTSIVNQLGKIDKQLNSKEDASRASISFVATFTSFKSNRFNTFKYPPDAEIKATLLDFNNTMSAVKLAVKEAVSDLMPRKKADGALTAETLSSETTEPEPFITPTKTISTFTEFPSPVVVKKILPTKSKNLCGKNSCSFGKKIRKPVWVKCGYRCEDGQQSCNYCVHAPCIGFPSFTDKDVQKLADWCCPDHTEIQMKRK